jgi:hypothetical protein
MSALYAESAYTSIEIRLKLAQKSLLAEAKRL